MSDRSRSNKNTFWYSSRDWQNFRGRSTGYRAQEHSNHRKTERDEYNISTHHENAAEESIAIYSANSSNDAEGDVIEVFDSAANNCILNESVEAYIKDNKILDQHILLYIANGETIKNNVNNIWYLYKH